MGDEGSGYTLCTGDVPPSRVQRRIQWGCGFNPPPPRTAQLIVKFGEKVLQIDYRCCKIMSPPPQPKFLDPPLGYVFHNFCLGRVFFSAQQPGKGHGFCLGRVLFSSPIVWQGVCFDPGLIPHVAHVNKRLARRQ